MILENIQLLTPVRNLIIPIERWNGPENLLWWCAAYEVTQGLNYHYFSVPRSSKLIKIIF